MNGEDCLPSDVVVVTNGMIVEFWKWFKLEKLPQKQLCSVWRRLFFESQQHAKCTMSYHPSDGKDQENRQ